MALGTGTGRTERLSLLFLLQFTLRWQLTACAQITSSGYTTTQIQPIRCLKCRYTTIAPENNYIAQVIHNFQTNATLGEESCKLKSHETDKYDVDVVECPLVADNGVAYKCSSVRGKVVTTLGVSIVWDTTVHDCLQVPRDDPQYTGCHHTNQVTGPLKELLKRGITGVVDPFEHVNLTFKGTVCYGRQVLPIPDKTTNLQCEACRAIEKLVNIPDFTRILTYFAKAYNEGCSYENRKPDYPLSVELCPEPAADERAVCASFTALTTHSAMDHQITVRGCATQPKDTELSACSMQSYNRNSLGDFSHVLDDINPGYGYVNEVEVQYCYSGYSIMQAASGACSTLLSTPLSTPLSTLLSTLLSTPLSTLLSTPLSTLVLVCFSILSSWPIY